jgi:transposase, IS30 family
MPGSRLTSHERAQIEVLYGQGLRFGEIAAVIGRDRSTVWREVCRNRSAASPGEDNRGVKHPQARGGFDLYVYRRGWGTAYRWRYSHMVACRRQPNTDQGAATEN